MFKFNFDIDDADLDPVLDVGDVPTEERPSPPSTSEMQPFFEISLNQLVDALPDLISYSPLSIPLASGEARTLVRRDLFDARFQLIASDQAHEESHSEQPGLVVGSSTEAQSHPSVDLEASLKFIDSPSDLVPGVYEGGLKTWECSLDLAGYLHSSMSGASSVRGTKSLEIGCGTGMPSLFLLSQIYSLPKSNETPPTTHIHLQDYNASVLQLVTFPNILLNWYMSPAAQAFNAEGSSDVTYPPKDPSVPGELPLTNELKNAFRDSLAHHNISIRFFAGSWESFDADAALPLLEDDVPRRGYDMVLTSETIYHMNSLPSLIRLLRDACRLNTSAEASKYTCLVAAKVLYFGVGGGVSEFIRAVEADSQLGKVATVWEKNVGVGRRIMDVKWS